MKNALVCIDYINEIVHPDGKLAGKGYARFASDHSTLERLLEAQDRFRSRGDLVLHVRVGFSANYDEHPAQSPLLGKAKQFEALKFGTWGTEFAENVAPRGDEVIINKHRISAFHNTALDTILRVHRVDNLYIAGVATDLAVQSAARDAHDRDYLVTVLGDACTAANEEDHTTSIKVLEKIATVITVSQI